MTSDSPHPCQGKFPHLIRHEIDVTRHQLLRNGIELFPGTASFEDDHTMRLDLVDGGTRLERRRAGLLHDREQRLLRPAARLEERGEGAAIRVALQRRSGSVTTAVEKTVCSESRFDSPRKPAGPWRSISAPVWPSTAASPSTIATLLSVRGTNPVPGRRTSRV